MSLHSRFRTARFAPSAWRRVVVCGTALVVLAACSSDASDSDDDVSVVPDVGFVPGCTPGERRCEGNTVVVCGPGGLEYEPLSICDDGDVCTQGACIPCFPNKPVCQGDSVAVCDVDGNVTVQTVCPETCAAGVCVTCVPGRRECRESIFGQWETWVCLATGADTADWTLSESCGDGAECSNGLCINPCQNDVKIDTNQGCDYYAVDLENFSAIDGDSTGAPADAQFAVIVQNPSSEILEVQVLRTQNATVPEVDLSVAPGALQVIELEPRNVEGSIQADLAWRVKGNRPFVAYQFNPLDNVNPVFSNDASLLLPTNALGREYVALTGVGGSPFVTVVSTTNSTQVDVTPTADVATGTVAGNGGILPGISAGTTTAFTLNAGEVLNLRGVDGDSIDLTGTRIQATRDIVVFSGNVAATTGTRCCADHLEQQLPPTASWGTRYVAARSKARLTELDHWTVVAREDGTEVTFSGSISEPVTLNAGQAHRLATDADFLIEASKPVLVGQFLASSFEVLPLGDYCFTDDDCDSGLCSGAGTGGGRCSTACTAAQSDCGPADVCVDRRLIDGQSGGSCRYRPCGAGLVPCPGSTECIQGSTFSVCVEPCIGVGAVCTDPVHLCQFTSEDTLCLPRECTSDGECGAGRCDLSAGLPGSCVSNCTPVSDCPSGHACLPAGYAADNSTVGLCIDVAGCSVDADCPPGHTCSQTGDTRNCQPIGDPAFMLAVPMAQWRNSYTFLAPDAYKEDYANIVFEDGTAVLLDGHPIGPGSPVGETGFRVLRAPISDGTHTVTADRPVGVLVYGYHDDVSYGYPAGVNLFDLDAN